MDTFVYVDGFNLYYSLFKGESNSQNRSLKWVNLEQLVPDIVKRKYSQNKFLAVKYYTAHVSGKEDPKKPIRQQAYLNAIDAYCDITSIYYGKFKVDEDYRATVSNDDNLPDKVEVYLPEEKGSDVNLASHLIWDAVRDKYEVAVVLTNDTDLSEAFRIVSDEMDKNIILVQASILKGRTAKSLKKYSFDTFYIEHEDLKRNQLPKRIPKTKYSKPEAWE